MDAAIERSVMTEAPPVSILPDAARAWGDPDARPGPSAMSRLELLVDLASLLAREVDFDQLLGTAC